MTWSNLVLMMCRFKLGFVKCGECRCACATLTKCCSLGWTCIGPIFSSCEWWCACDNCCWLPTICACCWFDACNNGIFNSGWMCACDGKIGGRIFSTAKWNEIKLNISKKTGEMGRLSCSPEPSFGFACNEYFGLRFRFCIPSFFMLCGRLTLCNL